MFKLRKLLKKIFVFSPYFFFQIIFFIDDWSSLVVQSSKGPKFNCNYDVVKRLLSLLRLVSIKLSFTRKVLLQNDTEKLNGINIISPIMLTWCRDSYATIPWPFMSFVLQPISWYVCVWVCKILSFLHLYQVYIFLGSNQLCKIPTTVLNTIFTQLMIVFEWIAVINNDCTKMRAVDEQNGGHNI
jgi:hypothetical protein